MINDFRHVSAAAIIVEISNKVFNYKGDCFNNVKQTRYHNFD